MLFFAYLERILIIGSTSYTIPTISLIHFLTVYEKFLKISIVLLRLLQNVKWCSEQQLYIIRWRWQQQQQKHITMDGLPYPKKSIY